MVGFAENVYLWRRFKGLSQGELAERSGIPRPNISAIESGKREVSLTTLRLLAMALGTTPGALVNGVGPMRFKGSLLSRRSLEIIARASLGKGTARVTPQQKTISSILSGIIKNRINADKKTYKDILKDRQVYLDDWLMLKAALGRQVLDALLARIDKHTELIG
ncbi:MAG: helix-turn-helix domain-containing protein [Candidatus Omnitrophica bacterium]|nr:helix-turn-helix domain-containing protein [Candidatus Omnitrophota bacterium]